MKTGTSSSDKMSDQELLGSIEKLFDVKIEALEKLLSQAVEDLDKRFTTSAAQLAIHTIELAEASQKATNIAAIALDKRLEVLDEFRATLSAQSLNFSTKQEHNSCSSNFTAEIKELRDNSYTHAEHEAYAANVASQNKALADAAEKATIIQAVALDKRLETMNEFRATLSDQAVNFYTRQEHDVWAKGIESDIRVLRETRAEIGGLAKASQLYLTFVLAMIGTVCGIIGLVLRFWKV
jgi:hypothetical protein